MAPKAWSESALTRKACRELVEAYGASILPIVANKMASAGWPDRYIAMTNWRGFVEFKLETKLSALQRATCRRLRVRNQQPLHIIRWSGDHKLMSGHFETLSGHVLGIFESLGGMVGQLSALDDAMLFWCTKEQELIQ